MKFREIDPVQLAGHLTKLYGLPLRPSNRNNDLDTICLSPVDLDEAEGFIITIGPQYHRVKIRFVPGMFAADLIREMEHAPADNRLIFAECTKSIRQKRGQVVMTINGSQVDEENPEKWIPAQWNRVDISVSSGWIEDSEEIVNSYKADQYIIDWVGHMISLVYTLLPIEEDDNLEDFPAEMGYEEGARLTYAGSRYERSRINRAACIASHGTRCAVCNIEMGEIYGSRAEGLIQVHHIIPLSEMGGGYRINPVKDLVPLCPNCHAVIHRRKPPYTIQELKETYITK